MGLQGYSTIILTTPFSSPNSHCTMDSVPLSQKYMLPQSEPETIYSLLGPKKLMPFTVITKLSKIFVVLIKVTMTLTFSSTVASCNLQIGIHTYGGSTFL